MVHYSKSPKPKQQDGNENTEWPRECHARHLEQIEHVARLCIAK